MPAAPIARLSAPLSRGASRVELKSSLLMVDGKPFFPRAIEYRGEPLARLKSLGFNAIHLAQLPTQGLLDEAAGLGLWLIAPPPTARQLESRSAEASDAQIGPQFDRVLVWDLGSGLARSELEATRRWARLVQAADPRQRPLVCAADSELRDYTRFVNLLMARRDPLGTTLSLKNYMDWLRDRSQLARGGTPLWVTIQTEPAPRLVEQLSLLSPRTAPIGLQESQIRTLVHAALASRVRGMCFASGSRLDASDAATRRRAAILELVNLELHLIDRWAAAGNSATSASSNDPSVSGAVIETDRSRLLLPIYAPPGGQFVMGNSTVPKLSFKLLGVPEGNNAYELSLTSFRPLACQRVTGGTKVILGEADGNSFINEYDSLIVFTQDETVIRSLKTRLGEIRQRAAQLARDVVGAESIQVEVTEQRLRELGRAIPGTGTATRRETALKDLAQCDALLKSDAQGAYYQARHAQQALRIVQRAHWDQAVSATAWPLVDPFTANFATLPEHYLFAHEVANAPRSANRLP
jgi:hypothetical protein